MPRHASPVCQAQPAPHPAGSAHLRLPLSTAPTYLRELGCCRGRGGGIAGGGAGGLSAGQNGHHYRQAQSGQGIDTCGERHCKSSRAACTHRCMVGLSCTCNQPAVSLLSWHVGPPARWLANRDCQLTHVRRGTGSWRRVPDGPRFHPQCAPGHPSAQQRSRAREAGQANRQAGSE